MNNTPFSQQIAFLNKGALDDELTEELAEVVKQVRQTGKKGEVTLTITIQMLDKRHEDALKITPKVKTSIPTLDPYTTIMFSTADGDMLRDDPNQRSLDLRQVPEKAPVELKEAK